MFFVPLLGVENMTKTSEKLDENRQWQLSLSEVSNFVTSGYETQCFLQKRVCWNVQKLSLWQMWKKHFWNQMGGKWLTHLFNRQMCHNQWRFKTQPVKKFTVLLLNIHHLFINDFYTSLDIFVLIDKSLIPRLFRLKNPWHFSYTSLLDCKF